MYNIHLFYRKVKLQYYQLRWLCKDQKRNKYRIFEQLKVFFALFGIGLKSLKNDMMLARHLDMLNFRVKNNLAYKRSLNNYREMI